jgi:hypothetical protein
MGSPYGSPPLQMLFRNIENLEYNKNMLITQNKEITRKAQTKFFILLSIVLLSKVF